MAAIAFQVCSREEQDAHIDHEDNRHPDQERDVLGKSKDAHERKSKGEDHDESSHLREGFSLVDSLSTDQTVPEAAIVIQCLVPVEEDVPVIFRHPYPCRASLGIDIQCRDPPARLLDEDPHEVNGTGPPEGVANSGLVPDDHQA